MKNLVLFFILIMVVPFFAACHREFEKTTITEPKPETPPFFTFPDANSLPPAPGIIDALKKPDGTYVTCLSDWNTQKKWLKAALSHYIYGTTPDKPAVSDITVQMIAAESSIANNKAAMFTVRLSWGVQNCFVTEVRVAVPKKSGKYPTLFRLDYLSGYEFRIRGDSGDELELAMLEQEKYAFVTIARKDIAPDKSATKKLAPYSLYPDIDMGAISLWGYSAMVVLDYLLARYSFIDPAKIAISGHSRDGKAAMYAAAFDERFAVAMPSCSGIGGAAPFKVLGSGSETIDIILSGDLSSWFADKLLDFRNINVIRLPVDTGALFALMEGRSILCNQAASDAWANTYGTQQNLDVVCSRVKTFLGIANANQTAIINPGTHDDNSNRWTSRIKFCDRVFYGGN
jgi:hypothetical protein